MTHIASQTFIDEAMKKIADKGIILDVGGGKRFQKWLSEYEHLFTGKDYRTMDYDALTGPDIVGDIHHIPLPDGSVDAVICSSVLEHVANPILAVSEIGRILKEGGIVFVYVPSIYPYHARKGAYPDYWRFFDDTLEMLFKDFSSMKLVKAGGYFGALKFFIPLQHKARWFMEPVTDFLDKILKTDSRVTTSGYYLVAVK